MLFLRFWVKDKEFYKLLVSLALPVAGQNLIGFAVSLADTVMLGRLGEAELSAAAIAGQLQFIYLLFLFGIGGGCCVFIAQYWGKRDVVSIKNMMAITYRILAGTAAVFMCVGIFFAHEFMSLYTTDAQVIELGTIYINVIWISFLPMGIANFTSCSLRAVRDVKISLIIYASSLFISVSLNWVLIFGNLGFPAMGVRGAAISTTIARFVEMSIALIYMAFFEKRIMFRFRDLFKRKLGVLTAFIRGSLPVIVNEIVWGLGASTVAIVIGRMGRECTAAYSICSTINQLATITLFGVGSASAVIIGNTIGEGRYDEAKKYSRKLLAIGLILGIFSMLCILLLRRPIVSLFNITDIAKAYALQIIAAQAFFTMMIGAGGVQIVGVLRGGGDTRLAMVLDVAFLWLVSIPLGFIAAFWLKWPILAVFICLRAEEVIKSVLSFIRVWRGKWINDLTKISS